MSFFTQVYQQVKRIPRGSVATYGMIAALCGNPRMARQVGWALHANPEPGIIPCHRVVNRLGSLCRGFAFGGLDAQKALLEAEGIEVDADGIVNLTDFLWQPEDALIPLPSPSRSGAESR